MTLCELVDELVAAWRSGDALRASAFFAADGIYHESGREPLVGRDAIGAFFTRFFRDGPPWQLEISEVLVDGDRAAVSYRFGIQREGVWQTREGCALVRREGGLIAQWREYHG
jgi:uncharacterized protein (TIGR02246 family)